MAESVDALVSNTSGAIRAGSTPAQGTVKKTFLLRRRVEGMSFLYVGCHFAGNCQPPPSTL